MRQVSSEPDYSLDSLSEGIAELEKQNEELRTELVEQLEKLGTAAIDLLEANEFKDRFIGMAAHDLRNPINVVRMMSEMLMEMDLPGHTKKEFYEDINRNAHQMLALINDLLDVSAIESGTLKLQLNKNNLKSVLRSRVRMQQMNALPKNSVIQMDEDDIPDTLFDADRIGQVADNLLSNAVKYSPAGSEIRVTFLYGEETVGFAVEDEGPGIPEDELDRLFQEFAKLSTQPTGGETSTGLGLSIAKKIVDSHNGKIDVDSEVGRGTTFTVRLTRDLNS